jgi:hypothetical protein
VAKVPDLSEENQILLQHENNWGELPTLVSDHLHHCLQTSLKICKYILLTCSKSIIIIIIIIIKIKINNNHVVMCDIFTH